MVARMQTKQTKTKQNKTNKRLFVLFFFGLWCRFLVCVCVCVCFFVCFVFVVVFLQLTGMSMGTDSAAGPPEMIGVSF